MSDYSFHNLQDLDLERQRLARRRRIAEQLIATPQQEVQTKQFGDVMHVAGPTTAGLLGDAIARGLGQVNLDAADEADRRMAQDDARIIDASLASIPTEPGAQRQQAQLAAYVRGNPSLRKTLELQMGLDEKEAERIERGEQAAQNRVETAAEKEANRAFLGEQNELNRQNRLDVRQTPSVHISQGGNGPRDRFSVQQGPDGKMYRVNLETGQAAPIMVGESPLVKPNPAERKTVIAQDEIIGKVDNALKLLEANPDSVGLKTLVPDIALQRLDPAGAALRAAVGELGAEKTHELYGAAFSASEQKRANSFIPAAGDSLATIRTKLSNMRKLAEQAKARAKGEASDATPPRKKFNPATGRVE